MRYVYRCIENSFQDRKFHVCLGSTLPVTFTQANGFLQGSMLSITLFVLQMNSIVNAIPPGVQHSVYADDVQVSYVTPSLLTAEGQLQPMISCMSK